MGLEYPDVWRAAPRPKASRQTETVGCLPAARAFTKEKGADQPFSLVPFCAAMKSASIGTNFSA